MDQGLDHGHLMYLKAQMLIQSASRIRHQHVEIRFARVHLPAPFEHFADQCSGDTLATGTGDGIDAAQVEMCLRHKNVIEWLNKTPYGRTWGTSVCLQGLARCAVEA